MNFQQNQGIMHKISINKYVMQNPHLQLYIKSIIVSALLVVIGDRCISKLQIVGNYDPIFYIHMVEGNFSVVPTPFRYRILVPFLARLLPFSPEVNLMVITYISLFISYVLAQIICAKMGLNWFASISSLFVIYSSPWHLYNYFNPYMTDAFGLMVVFLMLFFLMNNSFVPFSVSSILGVLGRESTLFFTPVWLITKEWWKAALVILTTFIALYITRVVLMAQYVEPSTNITQVSNYSSILTSVVMYQLGHFPLFLMEIFFSWYFLWFLAIMGLLFVPINRFSTFFLAFALLLSGAVVSCFMTTDTFRNFMPLSPVMVILCAFLFSELIKKSKAIVIVLLLLSTAQFFLHPSVELRYVDGLIAQGQLSVTNLVQFLYQPDLFQVLVWMLLVSTGTFLSIYIAYILRDQLARALQEKTNFTINALKIIIKRAKEFT